ncbi:DUF2628 domain-containing protein [uncultured Alsobacter sp.]|uniref:DUF2628 domain-containing protein n=1 Tax=uncultured Alsobacter sp. TaxID=1748258 RepID=UPI0025CD6D0D|nr:DUF2628 domain-containing protein [uncultured Alsobacter sp.]
MVSYLVHLPAEARPGSADGLDRMVLVKDRFHWLAFLVPLVWLLFNRLWLPFLVVLAATVAVAVADTLLSLPDQLTFALQALLGLGVGVFAAELKSRGLSRRGLPLAGVATGADEDEAARRFADRWLASPTDAAVPTGVAPAAPASGRGTYAAPAVLGLFPEAGRS